MANSSTSLATQLMNLVAYVAAIESESIHDPLQDREGQSSENWQPDLLNFSVAASALVEELNERLTAEEWQPESGIYPLHEDTHAIGQLTLRGPLRVIVRGYLEPVRWMPLVAAVPDRVLLFLIQLPGTDESLLRERGGGIGWHYHFLNGKKQRSDVGKRQISPTYRRLVI